MGTIVEILKKRHASRSILNEVLPEDVVNDLAQAIRLTPSCFNNQPWRYLFVQSEEQRQKAIECFTPGNKPWASRAPLLVIGYSNEDDDCNLPDGRHYHQFDLGMATMNLMLAATEQGLVARPMAGFKAAKVSELFDLEETDQAMIMLAIGPLSTDEEHLPDDKKGLSDIPRERKEVSEVIRFL